MSWDTDPNHVFMDPTPEEYVGLQKLMANLDAVEKHPEPFLTLAELASFVIIDPRDKDLIPQAHPNKIAFQCVQGLCHGISQGQATRVRTISQAPAFSGVDLGFLTTVDSHFRVLHPGVDAYVCNVEGIYGAKAIFRKNIKAFKVSVAGKGEVQVWLSGASDIPECQ